MSDEDIRKAINELMMNSIRRDGDAMDAIRRTFDAQRRYRVWLAVQRQGPQYRDAAYTFGRINYHQTIHFAPGKWNIEEPRWPIVVVNGKN